MITFVSLKIRYKHSGTFGNSIILYASIKFNAINLDKVSLIFLRNIAVVDIAWTLSTTLTICVSNSCTNQWCLGIIICYKIIRIIHIILDTSCNIICMYYGYSYSCKIG